MILLFNNHVFFFRLQYYRMSGFFQIVAIAVVVVTHIDGLPANLPLSHVNQRHIQEDMHQEGMHSEGVVSAGVSGDVNTASHIPTTTSDGGK